MRVEYVVVVAVVATARSAMVVPTRAVSGNQSRWTYGPCVVVEAGTTETQPSDASSAAGSVLYSNETVASGSSCSAARVTGVMPIGKPGML